MDFWISFANFFASAIRLTAPIALGTLACTISERAGVINIGIEGSMIFSGFLAAVGSYYTGSPWVGLLCGCAGGAFLALILGVLAIYCNGQQIVIGIGLNLFGPGFAYMMMRALWDTTGISPWVEGFHTINIPVLSDIPVLGTMLSGYPSCVYLGLLAVAVMQYLLRRTAWGLRIRAVGENPAAVATLGINVYRLRLRAVLLGGVVAGRRVSGHAAVRRDVRAAHAASELRRGYAADPDAALSGGADRHQAHRYAHARTGGQRRPLSPSALRAPCAPKGRGGSINERTESMNITFHECRYILHLKDYDSGVFFYREVLGLQPNYNWSIVPDRKGYRFYMGSGRLEITQIPFAPRQGRSEFLAQCIDLPLCMERILEEMPDIDILSRDARQVTLRDSGGNLIHLLQGDSAACGGDVDKTDMFTGTFTGVFYEDDLSAAREFYCEQLGLPLLEEQADSLLLQAGDAQLLLRRRTADCAMGPSMIGLEASSVNKLYDRFSSRPDYREAGVLRDTDFDARRLFQMYDPSGNVVEIYAYLRNVREEILMH